jgi:transposase-like protein
LPQDATKQRSTRSAPGWERKGTMKEKNNEGKGRGKSRSFDETFKRHAVDLSLRGERTVKEVAEALGVKPTNLYQWRSLYGPRPAPGGGEQPQRTLAQAEEENRDLRAQVERLREREIVLKKSLGILSETPERGMPRFKR